MLNMYSIFSLSMRMEINSINCFKVYSWKCRVGYKNISHTMIQFNKLSRISDRLWSSSEDEWGIQYSPTAYLINKTRRIDITVCLLTKGWVCEIKLLTPDQTLGVLWAVRSLNTYQEVSSVYSYIYIRAEF